jgi:hypothetical protein
MSTIPLVINKTMKYGEWIFDRDQEAADDAAAAAWDRRRAIERRVTFFDVLEEMVEFSDPQRDEFMKALERGNAQARPAEGGLETSADAALQVSSTAILSWLRKMLGVAPRMCGSGLCLVASNEVRDASDWPTRRAALTHSSEHRCNPPGQPSID